MAQLALPLLNFSARAAELGLDGEGSVAEAQAKYSSLQGSHDFLKPENVKQVGEVFLSSLRARVPQLVAKMRLYLPAEKERG